MATTSRAAILWEAHTPWSIEETEIDPPEFREVRVAMRSAGLCHSDDHRVRGDTPGLLPCIGGHEGAGVVTEVGPGVNRLRVGDHVVFAFVPSCGKCRWCACGMSNLCDLAGLIALNRPISSIDRARVRARGQDVGQMCFLGTFAPEAVVHEDSCVKIDDDIPLDVAALVGCGVTTGFGAAVYRAGVQPGDTVVVVGAGGIGSSAIQGARIAGAEVIVAVDPVEFRRDQSLRLGATHAVADMAEAEDLVRELTRGVMADRAVLAVSLMTGDMVQPFLTLIRKGGRACLTSMANPEVTNSVSLRAYEFVLYQKELVGNVFGGANAFADIPHLLSLYQRGLLKLDELVTKRYTLEQVNEGYQDLLDGKIMRGLIAFD